MRRASRWHGVAALATMVVLMSACGGGGDPGGGSVTAATGSTGPRPASTATLKIVQPHQDQVVTGTSTPLVVQLRGAKVVQTTSNDLQPDRGHLHVYLDDALVTMTADTQTVLTDLSPGRHLLKVEFVATDHAPFDPRVIAAVTFEVKQ
jgi:Family of unknown function (DUF6130)